MTTLMKPTRKGAPLVVVLLAAMAATAPAATPKPGVSIYGTTSWKGGDDPVSYVVLTVARSGQKLSHMEIPSVCGIRAPRLRNFPISASGHFSGTRTPTSSAHGTTFHWTIKVTGTFTARAKAKGTFSATLKGSPMGKANDCHTGRQTWKATHLASAT
jgi:hypothetical protein